MLNIYSTASSIERDWKNKNVEINKIFDDKSFDLNPKEFEEKCTCKYIFMQIKIKKREREREKNSKH